MTTPDVSVVLPVFNTMPYLTKCLTSLVSQTIGRDRMRVIAVDDGSTDRSGRELDRFARRYGNLFTVIHQSNSGGPARPCNRGLDAATGRYVFFLGADDYLAPRALQRLVEAADRYGSDVVAGKVVGVNSRFIYQDLFARTDTDVDLFDSALPGSLANVKLFRRELLNRFGIRYREDMPYSSDLPFTLEACYRARRITVLADDDYYFAVRRLSATNISYLSRHRQRLAAVASVMDAVAALLPPGKQRDAVMRYRFSRELSKLVGDDLLGLDRPTQQEIFDTVRQLAKAHLTDDISDQLAGELRVRLAVARHGQLEDLLAVIGQDAQVGVPTAVADAGRRYAAYPGFRDPARRLPDSCFDVTTAADWASKFDAAELSWARDEHGRVLRIVARTPAIARDVVGRDVVGARAGKVAAQVRITPSDSPGTTIEIIFRVADLLTSAAETGQRFTVRVGAAALRTPGLSGCGPAVIARRGWRLRVIAPIRDESGRLLISIVPVTPRRVAAYVRRLLRRLAR